MIGAVQIGGANIGAILLTVLALLLLILFTARARAGRPPQIRRMPIFEELPAEIGRSAESGSSLHIAIGSGRLGGDRTMSSMAALEILEALVDSAVAYGTPPIVTIGDPTLLPVAQDILRRAYLRRNVPERYSPRAIRFIADQPVVYAIGAADMAAHTHIRGSALLGAFDEEASLITHVEETKGHPKMAAVDRPRALGALYPSISLLGIGEELYAGVAVLTQLPHHLASLQVQDVLRFLLIAVLLFKILGVF